MAVAVSKGQREVRGDCGFLLAGAPARKTWAQLLAAHVYRMVTFAVPKSKDAAINLSVVRRAVTGWSQRNVFPRAHLHNISKYLEGCSSVQTPLEGSEASAAAGAGAGAGASGTRRKRSRSPSSTTYSERKGGADSASDSDSGSDSDSAPAGAGGGAAALAAARSLAALRRRRSGAGAGGGGSQSDEETDPVKMMERDRQTHKRRRLESALRPADVASRSDEDNQRQFHDMWTRVLMLPEWEDATFGALWNRQSGWKPLPPPPKPSPTATASAAQSWLAPATATASPTASSSSSVAAKPSTPTTTTTASSSSSSATAAATAAPPKPTFDAMVCCFLRSPPFACCSCDVGVCIETGSAGK